MGTPAATELAFPASATYAGGSQIIQSPFQFLFDDDTFLRVISACSVTGVVISINGRRLDANGQLQVITETHTPLTNRSFKVTDIVVGKGALLNLHVFASAGAPRISQCYVKVLVMRNQGGQAITLGVLLGGCLSVLASLGFPGSAVVSPLDYEPVARTIVGTAPGASANIGETVPTGARWELVNFTAAVTVTGTGNEIFDFVVDDGANVMAVSPGSTNSLTSGPLTFVWWPGYTAFNTVISPYFISGVPIQMKLTAGSRLQVKERTSTAAWQWAAPVYTVREWLDL